jgi:hypothetical protein
LMLIAAEPITPPPSPMTAPKSRSSRGRPRIDAAIFFVRSLPVTKISRFAGSRIARSIVGQPRSTIDPSDWIRTGAIVIVNTAKGTVGEDTAALIGGTLINLVGLLIGEQAGLPEDQRRPATLIVDEFHTMPGADYEAILSELAKYGASLILATQSLARLEALDREQGRSLRATVFANLDGLFAFHTSAEDARYLVRELGGEIDESDLLELGEHQCYAKLSAGGERLPTFSVSLDPPPTGDAATRESLIKFSAGRYGRDAHAVEGDLLSALARIEASHSVSPAGNGADHGGGASDPIRSSNETGPSTERSRPRNDHRPVKHKVGASRPPQTVDGTQVSTASDATALIQGELDMTTGHDEREQAVS